MRREKRDFGYAAMRLPCGLSKSMVAWSTPACFGVEKWTGTDSEPDLVRLAWSPFYNGEHSVNSVVL